MRRMAVAAGVPESALLIEPLSRNTLENASHVATLLGTRAVTRVVLVTDSYHALRARLLFRLAGLTVCGARCIAAAAAAPDDAAERVHQTADQRPACSLAKGARLNAGLRAYNGQGWVQPVAKEYLKGSRVKSRPSSSHRELSAGPCQSTIRYLMRSASLRARRRSSGTRSRGCWIPTAKRCRCCVDRRAAGLRPRHRRHDLLATLSLPVRPIMRASRRIGTDGRPGVDRCERQRGALCRGEDRVGRVRGVAANPVDRRAARRWGDDPRGRDSRPSIRTFRHSRAGTRKICLP